MNWERIDDEIFSFQNEDVRGRRHSSPYSLVKSRRPVIRIEKTAHRDSVLTVLRGMTSSSPIRLVVLTLLSFHYRSKWWLRFTWWQKWICPRWFTWHGHAKVTIFQQMSFTHSFGVGVLLAFLRNKGDLSDVKSAEDGSLPPVKGEIVGVCSCITVSHALYHDIGSQKRMLLSCHGLQKSQSPDQSGERDGIFTP